MIFSLVTGANLEAFFSRVAWRYIAQDIWSLTSQSDCAFNAVYCFSISMLFICVDYDAHTMSLGYMWAQTERPWLHCHAIKNNSRSENYLVYKVKES